MKENEKQCRSSAGFDFTECKDLTSKRYSIQCSDNFTRFFFIWISEFKYSKTLGGIHFIGIYAFQWRTLPRLLDISSPHRMVIYYFSVEFYMMWKKNSCLSQLSFNIHFCRWKDGDCAPYPWLILALWDSWWNWYSVWTVISQCLMGWLWWEGFGGKCCVIC